MKLRAASRSIFSSARTIIPPTNSKRLLDRSNSSSTSTVIESSSSSQNDDLLSFQRSIGSDYQAGEMPEFFKDIDWTVQAEELNTLQEQEDAQRWRLDYYEETIGSDEMADYLDYSLSELPSDKTMLKEVIEDTTPEAKKEKQVMPAIQYAEGTITSPAAPDPTKLQAAPRRRTQIRRIPILDCDIHPYQPVVKPATSPHAKLQPHHFPLLSRYDWRLSSPLPRRITRHTDILTPPSLRFPLSTGSTRQGNGKLVGVGLTPAEEAVRVGKVGSSDRWGWKVPVENSEKGEWLSHLHWRKG
jgi:hypothetical protein